MEITIFCRAQAVRSFKWGERHSTPDFLRRAARGESVGRSARPRLFFAALCAAGRSVGRCPDRGWWAGRPAGGSVGRPLRPGFFFAAALHAAGRLVGRYMYPLVFVEDRDSARLPKTRPQLM